MTYARKVFMTVQLTVKILTEQKLLQFSRTAC